MKYKLLSILFLLLSLSLYYLHVPFDINISEEDVEFYKKIALTYNNTVFRDVWGVAHVYGKRDADVAFALAYAHSEDDFKMIQVQGLASRGKVASVEGMNAAKIDFIVGMNRAGMFVREKYETEIPDDVKAIVKAYCDGLNYYAVTHQDEVVENFFPMDEHSLLTAFVFKIPFFFNLDKTLEALFGEERPYPINTTLDPRGSNAFAVSPKKSKNGETFLNINSHQPLEGPVSWYEVHLHSEEGWDIAGATFPGCPAVIHGHTKNLGWGFTVNYPDLHDVYELTMNPENENQYLFDGEWTNLEVFQVPITVKLYSTFKWNTSKEAYWSIHGPVLKLKHGTYALKWAGRDQIHQLVQLYRMNKSNNIDEFQSAVKMTGLPMFNIVYADKTGNIMYLYHGLLPKRVPGYDWPNYLPGNTSDSLWTEYIPWDSLPRVINPDSGFVINTNNSPFNCTQGKDAPNPELYKNFYIEQNTNNRAMRALELFGGNDKIDLEKFKQIKYDTAFTKESHVYYLIQKLLAVPINYFHPKDQDLARAGLEVISKWNLNASKDNEEATLSLLSIYDYIVALINVPDHSVPIEKDVSVLYDRFLQEAKYLQKKYRKLLVPWGNENRLIRGTKSVGVSGSKDTIRAMVGEIREPTGELRATVGDSFVMIVTWDKDGNLSSESIHNYGAATNHPESKHYNDQMDLFSNEQMKPVLMNLEDIKNNLERSYTVGKP